MKLKPGLRAFHTICMGNGPGQATEASCTEGATTQLSAIVNDNINNVNK